MNRPRQKNKNKKKFKPFWVTVYTDASFKDGVGAWACWIRSGKGRIVRSGSCPKDIKTSNQAEFYAVQQAFQIIQAELPKTKGIFLNADSLLVVEKLPLNSKEIQGASKYQQRACHEILRFTNWQLKVRHVKSHQKVNDSKTYLNSKVDELAKKALDDNPRKISWFHKMWGKIEKKWYKIKKKWNQKSR